MNTLKRCLLLVTASAVQMGPAFAQTAERRAVLRGSGGNDSGKCTIEVSVDGSADVEIRGDRGLLRTLSGQPAQWRRFECSGPMPANPAEFRFSGVDGRGRQELVQDPRRAGGAAVVRIQDSAGGAEGYTFDLVWRGPGFASSPAGQPLGGGRDRGGPSDEVARACQDTVREKANQQYGLRHIDFGNWNVDDNPGPNDRIKGSFDVRRGNGSDTYRFSCSVDLAGGRVRGVEITQGRDTPAADRNTDRADAISACRRAAERQIQQDGYRDVQFGSLNADMRRNDWFTGTARAQRGENGRSYNFDIGCAVNPDHGDVRSLQVTRR